MMTPEQELIAQIMSILRCKNQPELEQFLASLTLCNKQNQLKPRKTKDDQKASQQKSKRLIDLKPALLAQIASVLHREEAAVLNQCYADLTPGTKTAPLRKSTAKQRSIKKNITTVRDGNDFA